jgi:hypothetical protein
MTAPGLGSRGMFGGNQTDGCLALEYLREHGGWMASNRRPGSNNSL